MIQNWQKLARDNKKRYKYTLQKLPVQKAIKILPALHKDAFSKIDCLSCGACCKSYSPRFRGPDIRRLASYLKLKETEFISNYLHTDDDGDYVLNKTPCPFLGADNMCSVYDSRPTDCRRFPYTNEDVLLKKPAITLKNVEFCPAVFVVLEKLSEIKL